MTGTRRADLEPVLRELKDATLLAGGTDQLREQQAGEWIDPHWAPVALQRHDRRRSDDYVYRIRQGKLRWVADLAWPDGYFEAWSSSDEQQHPCDRPACATSPRHPTHDENGQPLPGAYLNIRYVTRNSKDFDRQAFQQATGRAAPRTRTSSCPEAARSAT